MDAAALTSSRAALVGPYQGSTLLPVNLPTPIDKPERLAHWDAGPRLAICNLELLSGLHFDANSAKDAVTLAFVNLDKKPLKSQSLVRLVRPDAKVFEQQLSLVYDYAELRDDRGAEVLVQVGPPIPFWASIVGLQPHRHKWTLELLDLVMSLTIHVEMRFKHAFACPRPAELSPQIQSMIPSPGHAAWPSGHAAEVFAVVSVLQALLQNANQSGDRYAEQLQRLAARVATNRTVAGVHYPVDSAVGRLLGTALADFVVARATGRPKFHERGFNGRKFHDAEGGAIDFDLRVSMTNGQSGYYEYEAQGTTVTESALLAFIWRKAAAEWKHMG